MKTFWKKFKAFFKKGTIGWRLAWLTFIFLFLFVSIFTPFMLVEGANKNIGYILLGVLGFVYLIFVFVCIWDFLKTKDNPKGK